MERAYRALSISMSSRMRLALGLATLGLALGVAAFWGLMSGPAPAGDVSAVETALSGTSTTSTTLIPTTTTTAAANTTVLPKWRANETAKLGGSIVESGKTPTALTISSLGISAPVGAYGVDGQGRMDVPDNVTEVGWYRFGPSPGENGSAVLAAHVDLAGPGRGLFYELDELEPGDVVSVGHSDGSITEWVVAARSTYLKSELPLNVIFARSGPPVLTLVTCGGGFSDSARSYDSNVVVYAVPAESPAA